VWTHRWSSLVLGLLLLIVTTSGVPLLYEQEIVHARHADAYDASGPAALTLAQAEPIVRAHDPEFPFSSIYVTNGVYVADDFESGRRVTVDPSNGQILGDFNPTTDSGVVPWTMSLMVNIHVCGLTCEEYVGYQAWLADTVPGTGWLGFEGENVTWGGLLLGLMGLLLLFLAVTGIWFWWPGLRRWVTGFRVRWSKGRYSRDYDLHQVAGMIAVPLLLIWAFTGMGFEFGFVEKAWYAAVPGDHGPERVLESAESSAPDIGAAAAIAAAQGIAGADETPTAIDLPAANDPAATYGVWFADGFDPWKGSDYSGDMLVSVERKTGETMITYGGPEPMAQQIWEDWNFPTHAGWIVGPWLRVIWLVLGLVPLLLAFTGVSTWLYKRRLRKRRRSSLAT
jgi:uncharacterized iron-regulated membrane protein